VAYLGLLADYQGTSHLIRAAKLLKEQGHDVHFLIMGYPNEDYYMAMAKRLGVTDYVTLTGRVDYIRQAPSFLSLGDVAVSPKTSSSEGSGKVLNYMALAQPVVAYDSDVHREYLGQWGVYVNSGNVSALASEINNLLQDPERRRTLGEGLRRRAASHFSWEAASVRIENLYKSLLLQQNSVRTSDSV
jgi:glycosyltransferase involved in cell wall biosynthesis